MGAVSATDNGLGFTPRELRELRALRTPAGIQRAMDAMPYHLAGTAWSPRRVLHEWAAEPVAAPPQLRDEFMLKVFAGAEPDGFVEARLAWHRGKLEELGGYLENVRAAGGDWVRSERVLLAGLAYHHKMIAMIEELSAAADRL